jgi:hypothetical protein
VEKCHTMKQGLEQETRMQDAYTIHSHPRHGWESQNG